MTLHLGNVAAGSTIYVPFHTFDANGASVTISGLATTDIEIYKNGSTTERASEAGYALLDTDGIDFGGKTGIHGFSIDLSDNTDAGDANTFAASAITATAIASNALTSAKIAADAITPTQIKSVGRGTVDAGATTTSIPTSACTPAGAAEDQFAGRVILFDDDTSTAELRGQATSISASSNAAAPTFTVVALTTAASAGDLFSIV
jgi:hypothetical protein